MSVQSYAVEALPPNLHYILLKQTPVFAIQCCWICRILIQSSSQLLTQCTTCTWAQQSTCLKLWIEKELLTNANLLQIEARAKLFRLPADIGRLPSNILSGYSGFTANQWCNWITIYSPVLLEGYNFYPMNTCAVGYSL